MSARASPRASLEPRPSPFDEPSLPLPPPPPRRTASQLPPRGSTARLAMLSAAESRRMAWEDAWEEANEAPMIAANFSSAFPSILLSRRQLPVEPLTGQPSLLPSQLIVTPQQEHDIKVAEQESGWAAWQGEFVRVLVLALPLAVSE